MSISPGYLNNALASRGLLRDGPLDFSSQSQCIDIIHSLLQKRDREFEAKEALAEKFDRLSREIETQTVAAERLRTRCDTAERQIDVLKGQLGSANAQLRQHQSETKGLKDTLQRQKLATEHLKSQFSTDLRKKEKEMSKLKERIADPAITRRTNRPTPTISIAGYGTGHASPLGEKEDKDAKELITEDSWRSLTETVQAQFDENARLTYLLQTVISTLGQLTTPSAESASSSDELVIIKPGSAEDLTSELQNKLDALEAILHDPNFVPLEEVLLREQQNGQLRTKVKHLEEDVTHARLLAEEWRLLSEKNKQGWTNGSAVTPAPVPPIAKSKEEEVPMQTPLKQVADSMVQDMELQVALKDEQPTRKLKRIATPRPAREILSGEDTSYSSLETTPAVSKQDLLARGDITLTPRRTATPKVDLVEKMREMELRKKREERMDTPTRTAGMDRELEEALGLRAPITTPPVSDEMEL
ncbi:hypothetical protein YB2330_001133 [Saitoella coloradoensis]